MKPSPYFTDHFRYFFKRFSSQESLFSWFVKRAGNTTEAFSFPDVLKGMPRTLVFLPRDIVWVSGFLKSLPQQFIQISKFCVHDTLQSTVSSFKGKAFYYSDSECRYGEGAFVSLEKKIKEFAPQVCIYLDEPFLPRLYLAQVSGAVCRIGFHSESFYPFLNLSLHPEKSSEAELICQYYGV